MVSRSARKKRVVRAQLDVQFYNTKVHLTYADVSVVSAQSVDPERLRLCSKARTSCSKCMSGCRRRPQITSALAAELQAPIATLVRGFDAAHAAQRGRWPSPKSRPARGP